MTDTAEVEVTSPDIKGAVDNVLKSIDREREREIIARRFGLYDRKETLEQIGEMLGITRERVRQLEKAILIRLKIASEEGQADVAKLEKEFIKHLSEMGGVARVKDLSEKIKPSADQRDVAHVAFVSTLAPNLAVVDENDDYFQSVGLQEHHDNKKIKENVDTVYKAIKDLKGKPVTIDELFEQVSGFEHPANVRAAASVSKHIASLKDKWGLVKNPLVNPKNIRDKIYAILAENGKPMHFSKVAEAIKNSDFKRRHVTQQAIHNELIKDSRFVLIGRGIYALSEWGYSSGTVADIISDILRSEGPLHRDDIVRKVLKKRQVKETTILLNLQGKPQFKRVARATYGLAEEKK
jgi:hypothetical protein